MTGAKSEWVLRLARPKDAATFAEIEDDAASLFNEEPSLAGIEMPPSRSAETYTAMIGHGHCLIAEAAGEGAGFAACRPYGRELHLHELSVARRFQRRGIGATLLEAVRVNARNAGFSAITLNTFHDIVWNAPFYSRHGFEIVENIESHPRLAAALEGAVKAGLPRERRCGMIHFLN